jgi:hypothetical protein
MSISGCDISRWNHDVGTHKVRSSDYGEGVGNEEDEVRVC